MLVDLFRETERLREELMSAVKNGSRQQMVLFRQLQECLLKVREVGNTKLDVSAQMLDMVSLVVVVGTRKGACRGLVLRCHAPFISVGVEEIW